MEIGNKMEKMSWKAQILIVLLAGTLHGFLLYLMGFISDDLKQPLLSVVFQGVFFGLFMGLAFPYFFRKGANKFSSKVMKKVTAELKHDEIKEAAGPASLFRGIEAVGGKLLITNKRLIFIAHKINFQRGKTSISFSDIEKAEPRKTKKLVDNGILITTKEKTEYKFIVNDREVWLQKINEKLKQFS